MGQAGWQRCHQSSQLHTSLATCLPSHPCTHHSSTCLMESIYMQNPQKKAVINEVLFITIMQMRLISAAMNMQILQL